MNIILICLLVCFLGAFTYALAGNEKLQEMGRIAFACGLLVTLFEVSKQVVRL